MHDLKKAIENIAEGKNLFRTGNYSASRSAFERAFFEMGYSSPSITSDFFDKNPLFFDAFLFICNTLLKDAAQTSNPREAISYLGKAVTHLRVAHEYRPHDRELASIYYQVKKDYDNI